MNYHIGLKYLLNNNFLIFLENKTINKGRPDKEELNHYIDDIFKVIKTDIHWRALSEKFVKQNNLNIFENIHKIIIRLFNTRDIFFDSDKNLYID